MLRKLGKQLIVVLILFLVSSQINYPTHPAFAQSNPSVSANRAAGTSYTITANFSDNVSSGNIIDLELYNSQNQKVWQSFTQSGGNSYSATTGNLNPGSYKVSVGLFTQNWSSNYGWYDKIYTIDVSTPQSSNTGSSKPTVNSAPNSNSTYNITVTLPNSVPSGDIIDLELYNSQNQKVWQSFTQSGGNSYSATTSPLTLGTYTVSVGLFKPNWSSNYGWYDKISTINAGQDTASTSGTSGSQGTQPVSGASSNQSAMSAANGAYSSWKSSYLQSAGSNMLRVVRPDNQNDTVSEGIGYGMLLSYFASDQQTFQGLWNYGQKYLDSKGLMNWQINSSGNVIGQGSATDADEDMAYALLRAESKWPGHGYGQGAKNLINAMLMQEVQSSGLINPGDNWGNTQIMNPSYLAPAYYRAFAGFTGNSKWNDVANANLSWLNGIKDGGTGLVPDWLNADHSQPSISWDQYPNGFYYDAVRTPIRLLMDSKWNNSQTAQQILAKQAGFINGIGVNNLKSGYSLSGSALTSYLDSTFMAAYAAMGQAGSGSLPQDSLNALVNKTNGGYFGDSLRAISLFVIGGAY